jgi:hypothetical protein
MLRWIGFIETLPADCRIDIPIRNRFLVHETVCHHRGNPRDVALSSWIPSRRKSACGTAQFVAEIPKPFHPDEDFVLSLIGQLQFCESSMRVADANLVAFSLHRPVSITCRATPRS